MTTFGDKLVNKIFRRRRDVYGSETKIKNRIFLEMARFTKKIMQLVIGVHPFLFLLLIKMSVYIYMYIIYMLSRVSW
jgi:hypothetical protein